MQISTSSPLPADGALLTRRYETALPEGAHANFAYVNPANGNWTVVPSSLSADRRILTARVHHFSDLVDWWSYQVMDVLDTRVEAPTCAQPAPAWVDGDPIYTDGLNMPLRWCAGHDPKHSDWLVVKVRVNRGYGDVIGTSTAPEWTWNSYSDRSLSEEAAAVLLDLPKGIGDLWTSRLNNGAELPGGYELDFGFTESQVRTAPGGGINLVHGTKPDPSQLIFALVANALEKYLPKPIAYELSVLAAANCASKITQSGNLTDLAAAATGCIVDAQGAITDQHAGRLHAAHPQWSAKQIKQQATKDTAKLGYIVAAGLLYQTAYFIGDLTLPMDGYGFSVATTVAAPSTVDTEVLAARYLADDLELEGHDATAEGSSITFRMMDTTTTTKMPVSCPAPRLRPAGATVLCFAEDPGGMLEPLGEVLRIKTASPPAGDHIQVNGYDLSVCENLPDWVFRFLRKTSSEYCNGVA